ncbi:hypothetical protein ACFLY6_01590 [Candidatus Dependentiae bacterium]
MLKKLLNKKLIILLSCFAVVSTLGILYFHGFHTEEVVQGELLSDGSTVHSLEIGPYDDTGIWDNRKTPERIDSWVARQRGNSCGIVHALGRASMLMDYIDGKRGHFGGELENRENLIKDALKVSNQNERESLVENGEKLKEIFNMFAANGSKGVLKLVSSLESLVKDALKVENSPLYVAGTEKVDLTDKQSVYEIRRIVGKLVRKHKKRVDIFLRKCWQMVEASSEAENLPKNFNSTDFSKVMKRVKKHLYNIIYQVQKTSGEWNMGSHKRFVLRKMISQCPHLANLREKKESWDCKKSCVTKNFTLVPRPKTWARRVRQAAGNSEKLKDLADDPDFVHLMENIKQYRNGGIKRPQVVVLASFKNEDEDDYNTWGHWVTLLVKRNSRTGKSDVTYLESSHWWGTDAAGETAENQKENLEALVYLMNEAPVLV